MTKNEKAEVLRALGVMALALGQEPHEDRQRIYIDHLSDLPVAVVLAAISRVIGRWKFNTFPPVGVIRDCAGDRENPKALEERAMQVWDDLRRLSGRKAYNPEALMDPIARKCWRALGGTLGFGQWDYEKQEEWKRKQFLGLYVSYAKHPQRFDELTHVESAVVLERLNEKGIVHHG